MPALLTYVSLGVQIKGEDANIKAKPRKGWGWACKLMSCGLTGLVLGMRCVHLVHDRTTTSAPSFPLCCAQNATRWFWKRKGARRAAS